MEYDYNPDSYDRSGLWADQEPYEDDDGFLYEEDQMEVGYEEY